MGPDNSHNNADSVRAFQETSVPADTRLVGWAALLRAFKVEAPVRRPSVVSSQYVKAQPPGGRGLDHFDKRYSPGEDFGDQLGFALRHKAIDLLILKRLFEAVPQKTITGFVRSAPTGAPNRRAWFLFEFLTRSQVTRRALDIPLEQARRARLLEINTQAKSQNEDGDRSGVMTKRGTQVSLRRNFTDVIFLAPYVIVRRKTMANWDLWNFSTSPVATSTLQ